jgi:two-component system C4-dicarboxylate transport response regulator DctD
MMRVALVEDDADLRASTAQLLELAGHRVDAFADAPAALSAVGRDYAGVVVSDVRMPRVSGIEMFRTLHARDPQLPVILVTAHGDIDMAVDALKAGAWDFLAKPFDPDALLAAVARAATARALALENRALREAADGREAEGPAAALLGRAPAIAQLRGTIGVLGDADIDVLVTGETGTGKELVARLIHRAGKRARHRFVRIACAALPAGAEAALADEIARASRGTLFLDDIDRAAPSLQALLEEVVEQRAVRRGAGEAQPLDLRVVAASGEAGAEEGVIAPGLFHRLAAVRLRMPPLRERAEDVPLLFAHLLDEAAARLRVPAPRVGDAVRRRLATHDWPGNVRELAHLADRVALGLEGGLEGAAEAEAGGGTLPARLDAFERAAILAAIRDADGNIGAAIAALGLPRKTFYYRVKRLGIDLRAAAGR